MPRFGEIGSALSLLGYASDGEASDWMLKAAGVIAMSPELASESITSMTFDIANPKDEAEVIIQNMELPRFLIKKLRA